MAVVRRFCGSRELAEWNVPIQRRIWRLIFACDLEPRCLVVKFWLYVMALRFGFRCYFPRLVTGTYEEML